MQFLECQMLEAKNLLCCATQLNQESLERTIREKERVHLEQAVRTRHEGSLSELNASLSTITQYLKRRNLSSITPFCCKVLTGLQAPVDFQNMILDIYVGVNANVF